MFKLNSKSKLKSLLIANLTIGVLLGAGCTLKKNKTANTSVELPSEITDTLNQCTKCHSGSSAPAGFYFVTDQAKMINAGLITPGDAENSVLYQKISSSPPYGDRMPKGGPYLSATQMNLIAAWINGIGVTPTVKITSPADESYIYTTNSSTTFAISGTCSLADSTITVYVNGVASAATTTCTSGTFAATVDTTVAGGLFSEGGNSVYVKMYDTRLQKGADSDEITLNRELSAASVNISSHSDSPSAADRFATGADSSLFTSNSPTISGQCSPNGSPVTIRLANTVKSIASTTIATTTCSAGVFSVVADVNTLVDFTNYKMTATLTGPSSNPTHSVVVFKSVSPTVSFSSIIAPLLAQPKGTAGDANRNKRACIDCHYQKVGAGVASSNFAMGYWNACGATGGKPTGTTALDTSGACSDAISGNAAYGTCDDPLGTQACIDERTNFKFRFGYYRYSSITPAQNEGGYNTRAFSIVNDNPDTADSVANRVVRGNPNQSFIYKKVAGQTRNPTSGANPAYVGAMTAASPAVASFANSTPGMAANSLNYVVGDTIRFTNTTGAVLPTGVNNLNRYYITSISQSGGTTSFNFSLTAGGPNEGTSGSAGIQINMSSQDGCNNTVASTTGCKTSGTTGGSRMPSWNTTYMKNYFNDTEIGQIRQWITEGARTDN